MVRINLISPVQLADQHLIAEYNEILMLLGYVRKHPALGVIPLEYRLGKGHILFFKNKLGYLQKRFLLLKQEMRKRGFNATKTINLRHFPAAFCRSWKPRPSDVTLIKSRIREKILNKPGYYRYCGEQKSTSFLLGLLG